MATFVLDSSMVAAWLLPDENDARALALLAEIKEGTIVAPYLLVYEVRNLLVISVRRGRLTQIDADRLLLRFHHLRIDYLVPADECLISAYAAKHNLTAYDATFLALASQLGLALATFDKRLRGAAHEARVSVLPE